ncbi:hypothetical protein FOCC_FOCC011286 [Frankliniella occidentalis]|nr:hypothetical protein FOCC_FOCC011286 [Frankliniella occidentalis]
MPMARPHPKAHGPKTHGPMADQPSEVQIARQAAAVDRDAPAPDRVGHDNARRRSRPALPSRTPQVGTPRRNTPSEHPVGTPRVNDAAESAPVRNKHLLSTTRTRTSDAASGPTTRAQACRSR